MMYPNGNPTPEEELLEMETLRRIVITIIVVCGAGLLLNGWV